MSIEELVKKYTDMHGLIDGLTSVDAMRAALTEQAAEHDRKQALLLEAHCERVSSLQERIRELEAQRVPIAKVSMFAGPESNGVEWLIPHMQRERMEGKLLTAAPAPKEGE